jgi:hypothetical protein
MHRQVAKEREVQVENKKERGGAIKWAYELQEKTLDSNCWQLIIL